MGSLIALVYSMSLYRSHGAVEMQLEYACMPQGVVHGLPSDASVSSNEFIVPLWRLPTRDHGNRVSHIKMMLPMGEVKHQAQVVPCEDARETSAQLCSIGVLYMLIGAFVYAELLLAIVIAED